MGIVRTALQWLGKSLGYEYRNGRFEFLWDGRETDSGEKVDQVTSLRTVVVLRCATLIAGASASLPIDVYEKKNGIRVPAEDHLVEKLLDSEPNPEMTSMDFRVQQWLSFLLWGNAYAHVVREKATGRPIALWPLFPQFMQIKREEGGERRLIYLYSPPGVNPNAYFPDEVIHVRGYSLDGINGMSPIEQARNAIGLHRATEKSASKFFKNGAQVNLAMENPGGLGPEKIKEIRTAFEAAHGGADNAYQVVILQGGSKLVPIGVNPRDAQFLEQREYNDVQICMLFGVPPHMVGLVAKSTSWGTGIAEQKQGFLDFTVAPLLTMHEKAYERCLLSKAEGRRYIKHNVNAFLRADIAARFEAYVKAVDHGIFSRNEVRELEEKGPVDGGDKVTVQSQFTTLDQVGVVPPSPPARPEGTNV